ncbi:MAG TPA: TlyA family RNA methyltransferase [Bacillota bacterium]
MSPSGRARADSELVRRGLFPSRARAQAAILAGQVFVDGRPISKAGELVPVDAPIEVRADPVPYASRGGLKLAHALDALGLDVAGRVALDVGASTGGFTDVLLRRGARRVYAVDVGYGQLAWSLRQDPRVTAFERTNARYLEPGLFPEPPDVATVDVSFISVRKLLPALSRVLIDPADVVVLVKPQFEAGRERVGKGGIVRDPRVQVEVMHDLAQAAGEYGLVVRGVTYSPVPGGGGPGGNLEFFQWWSRRRDGQLEGERLAAAIQHVVRVAWERVAGTAVPVGPLDGSR